MILRFFYKLMQSYERFMMGRYGNDEYNIFLVILSIGLSLLSRVPYLFVLYFVSLGLLAFAVFRICSRNISKRYEERTKFLKIKNKFTAFCKVRSEAFRNRKTHKYFRCKKCKASIRVPKGAGKIEVTCPRCRYKFIKKV